MLKYNTTFIIALIVVATTVLLVQGKAKIQREVVPGDIVGYIAAGNATKYFLRFSTSYDFDVESDGSLRSLMFSHMHTHKRNLKTKNAPVEGIWEDVLAIPNSAKSNELIVYDTTAVKQDIKCTHYPTDKQIFKVIKTERLGVVKMFGKQVTAWKYTLNSGTTNIFNTIFFDNAETPIQQEIVVVGRFMTSRVVMTFKSFKREKPDFSYFTPSPICDVVNASNETSKYHSHPFL